MIAWRNEEGSWLCGMIRHTHTGMHMNYWFSDDISNAIIGAEHGRNCKQRVTPIEVEVRRIVTIKEE